MSRAGRDRDDTSLGQVRLNSRAGRIVLVTTVAGASVTLLTGSAVFVALPTIANDLGASSAQQQWIVNAFLLVVSSLILIGGTLGDHFGRVRMYRIGVTWVGLVSIALAFAPNIELLIFGRLIEALGAALVIPGGLAILEATLHPDDRGRGIGAWAGLVGIAAAIGPLGGGLLLELSWRAVFLLNSPAVIIALIASRGVPESSNLAQRSTPIDWLGSLLTITALGGLSFALIEGPSSGFVGLPLIAAIASLLAVIGIIAYEPGHEGAILPVDLFSNRTFTVANLLTFLLYSAIGLVFFLLPTQLQVTLGFSPFESSLVFVPLTILMLTFSAKTGDFAQRRGPRMPLIIGSLVLAVSLLGFSFIGPKASSLIFVLAMASIFGAALAIVVAPVTSTALSSVPAERAGAASGFNNAVSRTAQLLAVAAIPPLSGLTGAALTDAGQLNTGFQIAMWIIAAISVGAAALATTLGSGSHLIRTGPRHHRACPIDGTIPHRPTVEVGAAPDISE